MAMGIGAHEGDVSPGLDLSQGCMICDDFHSLAQRCDTTARQDPVDQDGAAPAAACAAESVVAAPRRSISQAVFFIQLIQKIQHRCGIFCDAGLSVYGAADFGRWIRAEHEMS